MATIFFKINDTQEAEVRSFMEEEGYTNKAEFFRFLIKFYKYRKSPEDLKMAQNHKKLVGEYRKSDKSGDGSLVI